jgi:hypothetical protein
MEVFEAIENRKSIRKYQSTEIEDDLLWLKIKKPVINWWKLLTAKNS